MMIDGAGKAAAYEGVDGSGLSGRWGGGGNEILLVDARLLNGPLSRPIAPKDNV